jgi:hypothetical protein
VGGDDQVAVVVPGEPLGLALAARVHQDLVEQPRAVPRPVADHPGDADRPPPAAAADRSTGDQVRAAIAAPSLWLASGYAPRAVDQDRKPVPADGGRPPTSARQRNRGGGAQVRPGG